MDMSVGKPVSKTVNLIKLSVGTESVDSLAAWQKTRAAQHPKGLPYHVTRMWPKREEEILAGGSVYWVIKGSIQARQRITGFEELIGDDGIRRCAFVLDPELVRLCEAGQVVLSTADYIGPEGMHPAFLTRLRGVCGSDPLPYCGGLRGLQVYEVQGAFRIEEYDGAERIVEASDDWW